MLQVSFPRSFPSVVFLKSQSHAVLDQVASRLLSFRVQRAMLCSTPVQEELEAFAVAGTVRRGWGVYVLPELRRISA